MKKSGLIAACVGIAVAGCGGMEAKEATPTITWEEFLAQAHHDEGDVYVVNGDEAFDGVENLRAFYDENFASQPDGKFGTKQSPLAIYRLSGADVKLSSSVQSNITYCISSSSFGSRYNAVVSAMNTATAAWEGAARLNFVHLSQYDSNCTASQANVFFDVRQTTTTSYLARAFFPNSARSGRNVLISTSAFGSISPWTLAGVLRHELGHTVGMRHEHTRPEAGTCFEDNNWRGVTTYDSSSVMHYPQCNGTQGGDLVLTSKDKTGVKSVYP